MEGTNLRLSYFAIISLLILMTSRVSGQEENSAEPVFPSGIAISFGIGNYSIKDEYISNQKYTGPLPYYSASWTKRHNKYTYALDMSLRYSDNLQNYNVSTEITQFTLNHGFLYPLNKASLFGKDLFIWLGPSSDLFFLYNKPRIAVSGFDYAQSYALLFSLGFNANAVCRLNEKILLESSVNLSILSLGFRSLDMEENDRSAVRFMTALSGMNSSLSAGFRYYLVHNLSLRLAYRFEFTRITGWEPLNAASDNIVVSVNYRF
jgi:hypothetical protein